MIKVFVALLVVGLAKPLIAQDIVIDSIGQNGSITAWGLRPGTTATVEWASSLTEYGRTNWHSLSQIAVTNEIVTADIPMFFRVSGTPDTNLPSGLVAYYPFNGNVNDESGNGHNGIAYGENYVTNRFGLTNSAYAFNGSSYIDTGFVTNYPMSVSLWVFIPPTGISNNANIFGSYGGNISTYDDFVIGCGTNNTFYFRAFGGSNAATSDPVANNQWVHLVAILQASPVMIHRLVVNGHAYDATLEGSIPLTSRNLYIGAAQETSGVPFKHFIGLLDDVRIYGKALSDIDVWKLRNLPY